MCVAQKRRAGVARQRGSLLWRAPPTLAGSAHPGGASQTIGPITPAAQTQALEQSRAGSASSAEPLVTSEHDGIVNLSFMMIIATPQWRGGGAREDEEAMIRNQMRRWEEVEERSGRGRKESEVGRWRWRTPLGV